MHARLPEKVQEFARSLRLHQTDAETLLWSILRNRGLGVKFRRQHPVGNFILDFYCHEARLCIELDGGQHNSPDTAAKDASRSGKLGEAGIRVLRFWDHDVLINTEAVLERIYQVLMDRIRHG